MVLVCVATVLQYQADALFSGKGFVRSNNISTANWNAATQIIIDGIAQTLIGCGQLCLHRMNFVSGGICNAFSMDKAADSCTLANVTFLEDPQIHLANTVRLMITNRI